MYFHGLSTTLSITFGITAQTDQYRNTNKCNQSINSQTQKVLLDTPSVFKVHYLQPLVLGASPHLSFFVGLCISHTSEFNSTMPKSSYGFKIMTLQFIQKSFNEGKIKWEGKVPTYRSKVCCSVSAHSLYPLMMYFNRLCNTLVSP